MEEEMPILDISMFLFVLMKLPSLFEIVSFTGTKTKTNHKNE
jgi:hypothetical protein